MRYKKCWLEEHRSWIKYENVIEMLSQFLFCVVNICFRFNEKIMDSGTKKNCLR